MRYVIIVDGFSYQVQGTKRPANVDEKATSIIFEDATFCRMDGRRPFDSGVTFVDQGDSQYVPEGTAPTNELTMVYVRRTAGSVILEVPGRGTIVKGDQDKFQVNLGDTSDPRRGIQVGQGNTQINVF